MISNDLFLQCHCLVCQVLSITNLDVRNLTGRVSSFMNLSQVVFFSFSIYVPLYYQIDKERTLNVLSMLDLRPLSMRYELTCNFTDFLINQANYSAHTLKGN